MSARPAPATGALSAVLSLVARLILRLAGWKRRGDWPAIPKAVLLAAPHTSNWDGLLMLATAAAYRVPLRWMGKKSLVTGPFGGIVRWLGCVPVDRSSPQGMVQGMADAFAATDRMILAIPPEGTRAAAPDWKRGYYQIAVAAGVPIIFSVLDFGTRTVTISGALMPSGDYEADWPLIRSHYAKASGLHPANFILPPA